MPAIRTNRVLRAQNTNQLSFTPPAGRAIRLTDLKIYSTTTQLATLKAGRFSVYPILTGQDPLTHTPFGPNISQYASLITAIRRDLSLDPNVYVQPHEQLTIQLPSTANEIFALFDEIDPADITPDTPNHKEAKAQLQILYGTNASDLTSPGTYRIDQALTPPEFTSFPFETEICPYDQLDIYAIMVTDLHVNSYPSNQNKYARTLGTTIWYNREKIFAETDLPTYPTIGTGAQAGSMNLSYEKGTNAIPFGTKYATHGIPKLTTPITVTRNQELSIHVTIDCDSGASIPANSIYCAIIALARRT